MGQKITKEELFPKEITQAIDRLKQALIEANEAYNQIIELLKR